MTEPHLVARPSEGPPAPFADGVDPSRSERRTALLVIGATVLLFLAALALAPPVSPTYDDAKYVGIGRNLLDGHGPTTVFGTIFLKHAPVWPAIIALPERLVGVHPIVVGHLLNALAGAAILILVGALGWRVRPALGALAAVTLLGLPYFREIAQTAGIDLPSIAVTFGYLLVGVLAVRRDSPALAAVAGLLLGVGFLVKETILPFAAVPFLTAVLWDVAWRSILRLAATTVAIAALATAWWFALYAAETGDVYRLGIPGWTLGPAAVVVIIFVVIGLAAPSIARRVDQRGFAARLPSAVRAPGRPVVGWALTIAWVLFLVVIFNGTAKLQGAGLFNADQIRSYLAGPFVAVSPMFALGVGTIFALVSLVGQPPAIGREARSLLVAAACGLPLVLLVVGVGEAPRHYISEMALLGMTGWIGWVEMAHRALIRRDRAGAVLLIVVGALTVIAAGVALMRYADRPWFVVGASAAVIALVIGVVLAALVARRRRLWTGGPTVVLVVLLVVASATAIAWRSDRHPDELDAVEVATTARIHSWIQDNVPAGSVIGIGPYLSTGTAMDLPAGYRAVMVRHFLAIGDPAAPLGLRGGAPEHSDWIAVDLAPGKANQFLVYEAHQVRRLIERSRPAVYVYNVSRDRSATSVLGVLRPDSGFREVASWSAAAGSDTIDTHIFGVDLERLAIDPGRMYISPEALDRLAGMLEREPADGRIAAAGLLERIVRPDDGSLDAGLTRLEVLAAGGG